MKNLIMAMCAAPMWMTLIGFAVALPLVAFDIVNPTVLQEIASFIPISGVFLTVATVMLIND